MAIVTKELTLRFLTPAFLGDAEQNARWRTPPIKHLLREWWRVVYAAERGYENLDIAAMREAEGKLFGNAWLEHKKNEKNVREYCKSRVRLRLDRWNAGGLTKDHWGRQELDNKVKHPEVSFPIGPLLYLGYGPLNAEKVEQRGQRPQYATVLKTNAAIQAGEEAKLAIAYPEEEKKRMECALRLMHLYGTLGGRSRNGWGSFELRSVDPQGGLDDKDGNFNFQRPWRDALSLDWPHAIGCDDEGPLIWRTKPKDNWQSLMRELAEIKIGLRTLFKFTLNHAAGDRRKKKKQINHGEPQDRHWLAYPVTNHHVIPWDRINLRLPNTLRFKIRRHHDGRYYGVIFHMPHRPPTAFRPDSRAIENVWKDVYVHLKGLSALARTTE